MKLILQRGPNDFVTLADDAFLRQAVEGMLGEDAAKEKMWDRLVDAIAEEVQGAA